MNDKVKVIGFEGGQPISGSPISWGCAAIQDGKEVVNACSGFRCSKEKWQEYVEGGSATALDNPMEVGQDWVEKKGAIVLSFYPSVPEIYWGHQASHIASQNYYAALLYRSREVMLLDIEVYKQQVMQSIQQMIDMGLTLSAHNLEFNVFRTAKELLERPGNDGGVVSKRLGKAILRTKEDKEKFERIFYGKE